jgi:hypothetical protein
MLEAIKARVATSAPGCAMAMGREHERQMKNVTLLQSGSHGPATPAGYPPAAARGAPPALMTGALRASVTCVKGPGGGVVASALVGPHTIYARTQEYGGVHGGDMWLWVRYVGPEVVARNRWRRQRVAIGPHPFVRPSRDAVIADGSAVQAANAAFMAHVWGG